MADKQVSVRMTASGGRQVKAEFTEVGREGARAFDQLQRSSRASGAALQNVGFQVQDFAVQVASGTSPTRALAQQLPQLLSGFGLLGVALGTAAAVFVPLIAMLNDSGDAAEEFEDSLKDLESTTRGLVDAAKLATTPMEQLRQQFGRNAAAVNALYRAQLQIARLDFLSSQAEAAGTFSGMAEEIGGLLDEITRLQAVTEAQGASRWGDAFASDAVDQLAEKFGMTVEQAQELRTALDQLGSSSDSGPQAVFDAIQAVQTAMMAAADESGRLPPVLDEAYRRLTSLGMEVLPLLKSGLGEATDEAGKLAAVDVGAGIRGAVDDTNMLIGKLIAAYDASRAIQAQFDRKYKQYGGRGTYRGDETTTKGAGAFVYTGPALDANNNVITKGGGGAQREANEMLREAQRLYEGTRTAAEKYEDEVERINELHREFAGIVTDEVRDRAIRKLQEDLLKTDSYAKQAAGAIRSAFDGLFDDPIAALEQLGRQLLQMALYQQLASSLPNVFGAGGIIPLTSFDGGGFTGFDARTGGLDGKGGFLAMLHPRETVVDHTRPGGRSSGVNVVVHNYSGVPARTERSRGPDGRELVRVIVGEEIARGKLDRPMKGRFGAAPQPVKR